MIEVHIPNNFLPERTYISDIIFGEFLGLDYQIATHELDDYHIILENLNRIVVIDGFFSNFQDGLDYLKKDSIPNSISMGKNQFTMEGNVPIIYGKDGIAITGNEITCGIDIFSSSFFMLSRFEESVIEKRDSHNRFPSEESLLCRENLQNRPIVNEYVEMLWNMLHFLGCAQKRSSRKFQPILTHDVDIPYKYSSGVVTYLMKNILHCITHMKNPRGIFREIKSYFIFIIGNKKDPYDTFDYLMESSENVGLKSIFCFMGGRNVENDYPSHSIESSFIRELMNKIVKNGHHLGFHPSYDTYNDEVLWKKEYDTLSSLTTKDLRKGRQHFLRFEVPTTWQIWEDNGMIFDCTVGFAEKEGFRCGTCYEFSVFNIHTRKKLVLKEFPLIVMDRSFISYQNANSEYILKHIEFLINKVKQYNGNFVMLWHNSVFDELNNSFDLYNEILNMLIQDS